MLTPLAPTGNLGSHQASMAGPAGDQPVVPRRGSRWLRRLGLIVGSLAILAGISGAIIAAGSGFWRNDEAIARMPRALVSRVDFGTVLTASGRVESSSNTIIACEIERLEFRSGGQSIASGGASTILWLVDQGTTVKKGDILCRLDSSEYEELVRQQKIKLEQARAILETGKLNFDVAELAVREYREGVLKQTVEALEGQIALSQANLQRATDRLEWTIRMLNKGYVAATDRANALREQKVAQNSLIESQGILKNLRVFGVPMTIKLLESEVEKRRYEILANSQRVTRTEERLRHYEKMVERCTIRAPHDGFVIYANDPRSSQQMIEAGATVRQSQPLFLLPDLTRMQVATSFHESVAKRVQKGMEAKVKIEGLANRALTGHVLSMAPLPSSPNWFSDEVKYFIGIVKLDEAPPGLLPSMTAEVEVNLDRRRDVLAIPTEAVAFEDGREVCYVAGADGLTRRAVTLGQSGRDLMEVTDGLAEGEEVVLNPTKIDDIESMFAQTTDEPSVGESSGSAVEGSGSTSPTASVE